MPTNWMLQAEAMREELVARRRDFHQHPETAFQELRTAGVVANELNRLGLEVTTGIGKTGVMGILEGEKPGPTVLVRSDMDALPVSEDNHTEYNSTTPGKMHACGHDGHMSIVLGVASLMAARRSQLAGRVKFIFQPAEETAQGAQSMINDGVLNDPRPDVSLALHLWNSLPVGEIGITPGPAMSGVDTFSILVRGNGGHSASPEQTHDPVIAGAQIVNALQTIASRNVGGFDTAVVSVTTFHAGDADNVIPSEARLTGTFRSFRPEIHDLIERRLREIATGIASSFQCTAEVVSTAVSPPLVNDAATVKRLRTAFSAILAPADCPIIWRDQVKWMAAEDMAIFLENVPGVLMFIGSANAERELNYPHHHPRFDFDERALPIAVGVLATAVAEYVLPEAK